MGLRAGMYGAAARLPGQRGASESVESPADACQVRRRGEVHESQAWRANAGAVGDGGQAPESCSSMHYRLQPQEAVAACSRMWPHVAARRRMWPCEVAAGTSRVGGAHGTAAQVAP